ncbi:MAG: arylsulfatase A-like enzyme [Planctomycetota bacterium]|jgi:arylsulfatase A-like enzyme
MPMTSSRAQALGNVYSLLGLFSERTTTRGFAALLACLLGVSSLPAQELPQDLPPHIVFLLADDLGWTDLSTGRTNGGNGSPYYKTPNLDALAVAGACFPNAYSNGPNCAPTRAALWSGQWAARTGIYTVSGGNRGKAKHRKLDAAANQTTLDPGAVTLAETLQSAGYTTAHFGKWHLGDAKDGRSPTDQGFDHQVGGDHRGGVGRVRNFADEQGAFAFPGLPANGKARQFMADRLTDEALHWMAQANKPLFCCISHYSVHTPIEAPAADVEATPKAEPGSRHQNRRYAAMLKNLDDNCGRVLNYLAETEDPLRPGQKFLANTLIVFTSDNGGLGGYRQAGIGGGTEVTNQLPLRAGKGSLFEGGTRVPFIVRWDGKVKSGTVDATPLQSFDLYPTFASIAQATLDGQHALDGVDLSGRLCMKPKPVAARALFWHFPGYLEANGKMGTWRTTPAASMRRGDLKVVYWFETRTWSLYDLAADINEAHDLASSRPDELRGLAKELRAWLLRTKAPMPHAIGGGPVALPSVPE